MKETDKGVPSSVPGTPLSSSKEVSVSAFAPGSYPWSWDRRTRTASLYAWKHAP